MTASYDRASVELTLLNKRQKGGWLFEQLMAMIRKLSGSSS
ncbi:MAG: hypothetical protein ACOCPQ_04140 [Desulfosudaceae bacterium]